MAFLSVFEHQQKKKTKPESSGKVTTQMFSDFIQSLVLTVPSYIEQLSYGPGQPLQPGLTQQTLILFKLGQHGLCCNPPVWLACFKSTEDFCLWNQSQYIPCRTCRKLNGLTLAESTTIFKHIATFWPIKMRTSCSTYSFFLSCYHAISPLIVLSSHFVNIFTSPNLSTQ